MTSSTVLLRETFPQARKQRQIGNLHRFFFSLFEPPAKRQYK
jgi:hypothetical protein